MTKERGNPKAEKSIRTLMHLHLGAIRNELEQGTLSTLTVQWLANRVGRLLAGEEPNVVFEYRAKRGRPHSRVNDHMLLALKVLVRIESGMKFEEAITDVADDEKHRAIVEKAYKKYRKSVGNLLLSVCDHPDFPNVIEKYLRKN